MSMSLLVSESLVVPRRRNGKQQACEPCRKRKLACDHSLPVCQRCMRRKSSVACKYVAAPMTMKDGVRPHTDQSLPVSPASLLSAPASSLPDTTTKTALFSNSSGYLGPTSFSAVFSENRSRLDPESESQPTRSSCSMRGPVEPYQCVSNGSSEVLDAQLIQLGIKILRQIPDMNTCRILSDRNQRSSDGWLKLSTEYCMKSMFTHFGKNLFSHKQQDIEFVASVLCKNAKFPLEEPDDTQGWLNAFSGQNLRWEALGILFSTWGYGILSSPDDDSVFDTQDDRRKDKNQFMVDMKECSNSCITLSSYTDCVNPLMVYLTYKNNMLESICSGDTSLRCWRQNFDLASLATALGLHREADLGISKVSIRSEMRRRIYASAFCIDKIAATFTGRPPALSHRYSSSLPPLDLSDEDLLAGGSQLSDAVAALDADGWNTKGKLFPVSTIRGRVYTAYIRDELLEISLGGGTHRITERLLELKSRSEQTYDRFPRIIKYQPMDISDPKVSNIILWTKLLSYLEHLQNHFLIERLSIKFGQSNGQALLDVAREMLGIVLILLTYRDRFIGRHHDYGWIIMYWGVPASGTLCVELLKQTKDRQEPRLTMSRSETIQNLSVFVGFLNWIKPNSPNSNLCFRIKGIITRVLDQLLETPPQSQLSEPQSSSMYDFDLPSDFNEYDEFSTFDLLDTFEWFKQP